MYKVAICEDDRNSMQSMRSIIEERYGDDVLITEYVEAIDLLDEWERMGRQMQEIILMDICFRDENGISIAKRLQQKYPHTYVIFVTGFVEYATEIFDADPVYFLLKPIHPEKLLAAMSKAIDRVNQNEEASISLAVGGNMLQLIPRTISYAESNLHEVEIHVGRQVLSAHLKLKDLEEKMPENFIRVHQSYLVNMDYIVRFTRKGIELTDGSRIPVSRARQAGARERFLGYLHGRMGKNEELSRS